MSIDLERVQALLERVRHLLDEDGEPNVVEATRFDGVLFDEAVEASPRLVEAMWDLHRSTSYAHDLYRDLFAFFYQGSPVLRPRGSVKRSRWANEAIMRMAEAMPASLELRFYTVHDAIQTANTLVKLSSSIRWWLSNIEPDPFAAVFALSLKLEGALDQGAPDAAVEALAGQLEQALEAAEGEQAADVPSGSGQGLMGALSATLDEAKGDAGDLAAGRSAFGMQPGALQHLSMAEQVRLGELLSGHVLHEWLDLLGLMMSTSASPEVTPGRQRLSGVRLSDDVAEMVAAEIAASTHPVLKLDHLARLADSELLTNDYTGPQGQGPVVLLCDESGSMDSPGPVDHRGQAVPRKVWAKGFILAVAQRMRAQHRPVRIISFSSANSQQVWQDTPEQLLAFASSFQAGMTAFEPALNVAIDVVRDLSRSTSSSQNVKAAIVLVTDDDRAVPNDSWLQHWAKQSDGWQTLGVSVGVNTGKALRSICEETFAVKDFLDTATTARLVNRVL